MEPPAIPHITEGFYPLPEIVETFSHHVLQELVSLAEVLPSMSNVEKKKKILDWLLRSRAFTMRLLVLARWVHLSPSVHRCIDVVAFLQGQKFCFQNLVHVLQDIRYQLSFARLRNSDLVTALDILSTGTSLRLANAPTSKLYMLSESPLSTKQILQTLHALNMLIRIRLSLYEIIPTPFQHFTIANGRCTFTVPNEFSVSLTTNSQDPKSTGISFQWIVVDFQFHLPDFSSTPAKYRVFIELHLNEEIAAAFVLQKPILPLIYNILHKFCLYQRLNLLSQQTFQLSRESWLGHLRGVYDEKPPRLRLYYWPQLNVKKEGKPGKIGHYIHIFVNTQPISAFERTLSSKRSSCEYDHFLLLVEWHHDGIVEHVPLDDHMDAQHLLLLITQKHAQLILEQIRKELHPNIFSEHVGGGLKIHVFDNEIIVKVNSVTGRLVLSSSASPLSPPRHLRAAEKNIALNTQPPAQILNRLYFFCIQTQLLEVAQCAELHAVQGYYSFPYLTFSKGKWRKDGDSLWVLAYNVESNSWSVRLLNAAGQTLYTQDVHTTKGTLSIESFSRLSYLLEVQILLFNVQTACQARGMPFEYLPIPPKALIEDDFTTYVQTGCLCIMMPSSNEDMLPVVFVRAHDGQLIFDSRIKGKLPYQSETETEKNCYIDWRTGRITIRVQNFSSFEKTWIGLLKLVALSKTSAFNVDCITLKHVDFTYLDDEKFRATIHDDNTFTLHFFNRHSPFHLISQFLQDTFSDGPSAIQPLRVIMDRTRGVLVAQELGYVVLARSLRQYRIILSKNHGIQVLLNRHGCILQDLSYLSADSRYLEGTQTLTSQWEPCSWLNTVWEGDLGDDELNGQIEAAPEMHLIKMNKTADLTAILKRILAISRKK
ncbi:mediator complex subunit Med14 [Schizosaccharomyces pombe]|uniref:Mediator of RNA polymerase II transcription subunit 14 n=2 Tax=Schizosaccharomyces pombe TaxID=4896 RepID=MED14_SCHPO|nr:mediator complex subunit Pmc1 [Schizosaccharomyces pombe]Q9P7Y4.2 RecName: Full=Mediator of RNA polymerase II transcription subunit 14; AltName: Full=Mediator complex subunit 14; AltName: Full=Mediator of RNA polymerase II complex subunit pmc1 [Schizosaccharomyces pombe 972h-]CAA20115.2 mediator complex subunit Pmc1 [Schizosaccharomyces pombe]|eukprot:NP_595813.2 mediator complex subunit Pmc1 [Schizosaccharomyces pombe]